MTKKNYKENIETVQVQVSRSLNGIVKDLRTRLYKVDLSKHPLSKIYVLEKIYQEKEKLAKRGYTTIIEIEIID